MGYVFSAVDGTVKYKLSGHTDSVISVAFNKTGTLVATGSYDGTVKARNHCHDVRDRQRLTTCPSCCMHRCGTLLLVTWYRLSMDRLVRLSGLPGTPRYVWSLGRTHLGTT